MSTVAARLQTIRSRIEEACRRAHRDPESVTLIGAAKRQSLDRLHEALRAGLLDFGENRVQEGIAHREALGDGPTWHLIGPLQSNKVKLAAENFQVFHAIDRGKIARKLDAAAAQRGMEAPGFLEINLGNEESKHGFSPRNLASTVRALADLENLRIVGLMAIPPQEDDAAAARAWFTRLRELRDELFARPEWSARPGLLSMGMSDDFEVAVEEGATHVRVGTALFGARD